MKSSRDLSSLSSKSHCMSKVNSLRSRMQDNIGTSPPLNAFLLGHCYQEIFMNTSQS